MSVSHLGSGETPRNYSPCPLGPQCPEPDPMPTPLLSCQGPHKWVTQVGFCHLWVCSWGNTAPAHHWPRPSKTSVRGRSSRGAAPRGLHRGSAGHRAGCSEHSQRKEGRERGGEGKQAQIWRMNSFYKWKDNTS